MAIINILIVEDDLIISEDIGYHLLESGYAVHGCVPSGEEAIMLIGQKVPDLIIMDIELEGELDGIETAAIIGKKHDIPIIYLTKIRHEATRKRATLTNPAAYLNKPFSKGELNNSIEVAIYNACNPKERKNEITKKEENLIYSNAKFAFLKTENNSFEKVLTKDILLIKSDNQYAKIITVQKTYHYSKNLKVTEQKISDPNLQRINKSMVLNTQIISTVIKKGDQYYAVIDPSLFLYKDALSTSAFSDFTTKSGQIDLPIGRSYKNNLFAKLNLIP